MEDMRGTANEVALGRTQRRSMRKPAASKSTSVPPARAVRHPLIPPVADTRTGGSAASCVWPSPFGLASCSHAEGLFLEPNFHSPLEQFTSALVHHEVSKVKR